jgi:hypothetical protein
MTRALRLAVLLAACRDARATRSASRPLPASTSSRCISSMTPDLVAVAVDEARRHRLPVIGHVQRTRWTEAARFGVAGIEHAAPWSAEYVPEAEREAMPGSIVRMRLLARAPRGSRRRRDDRGLTKNRVAVARTLMAMHTKCSGDDPRRHAERRQHPAPRPRIRFQHGRIVHRRAP